MTFYNLNINLNNANMYTKFDKIMFFPSLDIEQ